MTTPPQVVDDLDVVDRLTTRSVDLIALVNRASLRRLPKLLRSLADEGTEALATLSLVYPRSLAGSVRAEVEGLTRVRTVEAASSSKIDIAAAVASDLPYLGGQLLTAVDLREGPRVRSTLRKVARALPDVPQGQEWGGPVPLFVRVAGTPETVIAGYVAATSSILATASPARDAYVTSLALLVTQPRLETADPTPTGVRVRISLNSLSPQASMPGAIRVLLVNAAGRTMSSAAASFTHRSERLGDSAVDDIVAVLPLAGTSGGDHKLALEVDCPAGADSPRSRRWVSPRKGVLLNARPVALPAVEQTRHPASRYLIHTSGMGNVTYFTVRHGEGTLSDLGWKARQAKKDLAFVLKGPRRHRQMRLLRLLRLVTSPLFVGRTIWLVGERYDTAQDNGVHLFRHLRRSEARRNVYYVIDSASPQRGRVASAGHVIAHSSLRHRLLMLHADVLANAYSLHYLIPRQWPDAAYTQHLAWRIGSLRVYLKHGVHLSPRAVNRGSSGYDVMLTVMPRETEALRAVSGYDKELVETGLPRYDALVPTRPSRIILFMSTWRRYLVPQVSGKANHEQIPFEGSDYQIFMAGFLGNPRLQEMLAEHDYRLVMLPHYQLAKEFDQMQLAGDRITLSDTTQDSFQDQIRECDAFITDHSSVHFDIAYLGTPIIYARFDEHDFATRHAAPGWFDYDAEGYGPVTRTQEETLDALTSLLARQCAQDPRYQARIDQAFTFRDEHNSARAIAATQRKLSELR